MCQLLLLPDKPGNTKYTPKHKLLPLRERPVERVSARADACTIIELLAAMLLRQRNEARAELASLHKVPSCGHPRQYTLVDYDLCLYCEVTKLRRELRNWRLRTNAS